MVALAISTTFSNKNEYPYLARIIPNDFIQVRIWRLLLFLLTQIICTDSSNCWFAQDQ